MPYIDETIIHSDIPVLGMDYYEKTKLVYAGILPSFFINLYPEFEFISYWKGGVKDAVAFIGLEKSKLNKIFAKVHGLPCWTLHKGLYHVSGNRAYSFLLEKKGTYDDARKTSSWEDLLNSGAWKNESLINEAKEALAILLKHRLGGDKYSPDAMPYQLSTPSFRKRILILDEVIDREYLGKNLAKIASYEKMLDEAKKRNPGAAFFLLEPRASLNKAKSTYLHKIAEAQGVTIIKKEVSSLSILSQADEVYTVSSTLGLDAILLDKTVHCFGAPFYAGWGLTIDHIPLKRRKATYTYEEFFAVFSMFYTRYRHPVSEEPCSFQEILRFMILQRPRSGERGRYLACVGFEKKEQAFISNFFSHAHLHFMSKGKAFKEAAKHHGMIFSRKGITTDLKKGAGITPLVSVQRGILDRLLILDTPISISLEGGPYPNLDQILQKTRFSNEDIARSEVFKEYFREQSNFRPHYEIPIKIDQDGQTCSIQKTILIMGNVETPQSSFDLSSTATFDVELLAHDAKLIQYIRSIRPNDYIIYCPQSASQSSLSKQANQSVDSEILKLADRVISNARPCDFVPLELSGLCVGDDDETQLLQVKFVQCLELHSYDSYLGLEGLCLPLKLFTYGEPFYAGWGLTQDFRTFAKRNRRLSLEELLVGALITQPLYFDEQNKIFCEPENIPALLTRKKYGLMRKFQEKLL